MCVTPSACWNQFFSSSIEETRAQLDCISQLLLVLPLSMWLSSDQRNVVGGCEPLSDLRINVLGLSSPCPLFPPRQLKHRHGRDPALIIQMITMPWEWLRSPDGRNWISERPHGAELIQPAWTSLICTTTEEKNELLSFGSHYSGVLCNSTFSYLHQCVLS